MTIGDQILEHLEQINKNSGITAENTAYLKEIYELMDRFLSTPRPLSDEDVEWVAAAVVRQLRADEENFIARLS